MDAPLFVGRDVNLDHPFARIMFHWRTALVLSTVVCFGVSYLAEQSAVIYGARPWAVALGGTGVVTMLMAVRWVESIGRTAVAALFGLMGVRWLMLVGSAAFNEDISNPRGPLTSSFVYLFGAYFYAAAMLGSILPAIARQVTLPRRRQARS